MTVQTGGAGSGREARRVVLVPGVDTGGDALIDTFAEIVRVASTCDDLLIVGDVRYLPTGDRESVLAVHALARAQLHCRRSGSRLELHASSPALRRAVSLLGLDDVLEEYDPAAE